MNAVDELYSSENVIEFKKKITQDNYFVQIHNSFVRNKALTLQEKLLYIMGFGDECFIRQTRMQKALGLTKPTLRKLLKSFNYKGHLHIQNRYGQDKKEKLTNIYRFIPVNEDTGEPLKEILGYCNQRYYNDY